MQKQQNKVEENKGFHVARSARHAELKSIRELSPEDLAEWNAWREEDDRAWRTFEAYGPQVAA
jgi:hypothetical protein